MIVDDSLSRFTPWKENLVTLAISTIRDGNLSFYFGQEKEVLPNRKSFLNTAGMLIEQCVAMRTVDGGAIQTVTRRHGGRGMTSKDSALKVDALITREKDIFLFLMTGDCLPVVFYDPDVKVVALAHLSWKSSGAMLCQRVLEVLRRDFDSDSKNLKIWIGPGIHKESYQVSEPQQKDQPEWKQFLTQLPSGKTSVDLVGFNSSQLLAGGVKKENITLSKIDTAKSTSFFSHYRSVRTEEPEGRFATVVGLRSR